MAYIYTIWDFQGYIYYDLNITRIPNFHGTALIRKDIRKLRLALSNP